MGLGAGLEYGRFSITRGSALAVLYFARLIHVLADRRSHDQTRGVQLQRPRRVEGDAYAKNLRSGRRLSASQLVVAAVRTIPVQRAHQIAEDR